jgi:D-beta-D-heptose 7-phosphate kinase/D-beta-D-heptose 1-phosphate adenosyltransferase
MTQPIKVFVNGTFDVLHIGHLELLNYAKQLGDILLIAIDSDRRVSEKKGADRPFNNIINRLALLENLKAVDMVEVFDSDTELENVIKEYQPDIMVVGSDWKDKKVIGSEYAKKLVFYDRIINESTTKTIESYINRRYLH